MTVSNNLQVIKEKIDQACRRVNRQADEITIIGVTKYVDHERAKELIAAGITNLGENRPEELLQKLSVIEEEASWHFVGTLQSRKVRDVLGKVASIHSLDRLSIARQINNRSESVVDCFIQVNVSEEASKHGLKIDEVVPFIEELKQYNLVNVIGLMTMAPETDNQEEIRAVFKQLADLRDVIKAKKYEHAPCKFLSMGMSNDYEIAIEEGATHIRIGSKLVGK